MQELPAISTQWAFTAECSPAVRIGNAGRKRLLTKTLTRPFRGALFARPAVHGRAFLYFGHVLELRRLTYTL